MDTPINIIIRSGISRRHSKRKIEPTPIPTYSLRSKKKTHWQNEVTCDDCDCIFRPRLDQVIIKGSFPEYLCAPCPSEGCKSFPVLHQTPTEEELVRYRRVNGAEGSVNECKFQSLNIPNHEKLSSALLLEVCRLLVGKSEELSQTLDLYVYVLDDKPPLIADLRWRRVSDRIYSVLTPLSRVLEIAACNNVSNISLKE